MAYIKGKEIFFPPKINVSKLDATLTKKEITQNGEYPASADGVDGYSKIVVNVTDTTTPYFDGEIIIEKAVSV